MNDVSWIPSTSETVGFLWDLKKQSDVGRSNWLGFRIVRSATCWVSSLASLGCGFNSKVGNIISKYQMDSYWCVHLVTLRSALLLCWHFFGVVSPPCTSIGFPSLNSPGASVLSPFRSSCHFFSTCLTSVFPTKQQIPWELALHQCFCAPGAWHRCLEFHVLSVNIFWMDGQMKGLAGHSGITQIQFMDWYRSHPDVVFSFPSLGKWEKRKDTLCLFQYFPDILSSKNHDQHIHINPWGTLFLSVISVTTSVLIDVIYSTYVHIF